MQQLCVRINLYLDIKGGDMVPASKRGLGAGRLRKWVGLFPPYHWHFWLALLPLICIGAGSNNPTTESIVVPFWEMPDASNAPMKIIDLVDPAQEEGGTTGSAFQAWLESIFFNSSGPVVVSLPPDPKLMAEIERAWKEYNCTA